MRQTNLSRFFGSKLILVVLGVGLGLIGRMIFATGGEDAEQNKFNPAPNLEPLDILEEDASFDLSKNSPGLVQPISAEIVGNIGNSVSPSDLIQISKDRLVNQYDLFNHDDRAAFHAHGDEICASGCAASRHPTEFLPKWKFHELLKQFAKESLPGRLATEEEIAVSKDIIGEDKKDVDPDSNEIANQGTALDQLIYFGGQTRRFLESENLDRLPQSHVDLLRRQIRCTHAVIQIRVVDEHGVIRTWLPETRVPFDRRHVFDMEEKNLPPLVTSGTVKRVGLDYLWVRL